jgi:hypothetical protein
MNNNSRLLTPGRGGATPQGTGMFQNNNQPQPQQNTAVQSQSLNQLGMLVQISKRGLDKSQGQGGLGTGFGFSYESDGFLNSGHYGELRTEMEMDQLNRQAAIARAAEITNLVLQGIMRRTSIGGYYEAWLTGLGLLRNPKPMNPNIPVDPVCEKVHAEIHSNSAIYQRILSNTMLQLTGMMVASQLAGAQLRSDGSDVREMLVDTAGVVSWYVFIDWLSGHPNKISIAGTLFPTTKAMMIAAEECHTMLKGRYEQVPGAEIPWPGNRVTELLNGPNVNNPLFDPNMYGQVKSHQSQEDNGNAQIAFNHNVLFGNPEEQRRSGPLTDSEFWNKQLNYGRQQEQVKQETIFREQMDSWENRPAYEDMAPIILPLEKFSMEDRHQYDLTKYFNKIPGTEWYVGWPEEAVKVVGKLKAHNRQFILGNKVFAQAFVYRFPIFRVNMERGEAEVRFVDADITPENYELRMELYLSDPAKLLPYMWDDDGQIKTSWEPRLKETNDCVDAEGMVIPLAKLVVEGKKPNILVGNKKISYVDDEVMLDRLQAYGKTFDPKNDLDAFAMPITMYGNLTLETTHHMETLYEKLKIMTIEGVKDLKHDTAGIIQRIKGVLLEIGDQNLSAFVTHYLTTAFNRWLIECRGYPELGTGVKSGIHLENIFDDLTSLKRYLEKTDHPTLNAFLQMDKELLGHMFSIFGTESELKEIFCKVEDPEDPVEVAAMQNFARTNVPLKREAVVIQLRKIIGSSEEGIVRIRESEDPTTFGIIREVLKTTQRHFKHQPDILLSYMTPYGGRIRAVSYSEFDSSVISLRALDKSQGLLMGVPVRLMESTDAINAKLSSHY